MIYFDRLKQRPYSTGGTGLLSVGRAEIAEVNEDLPFIWQENPLVAGAEFFAARLIIPQ
jgi:hypothetical protein